MKPEPQLLDNRVLAKVIALDARKLTWFERLKAWWRWL